MSKRYDVVAKVGEYKGNDGEMKARWLNCGVVLEDEKGLSLKIECVPVGNFWNGWFMIKPAEDKRINGTNGTPAAKAPAKPQSEAKPAASPVAPDEQKDAGDLPF